MMGRTAFWTEDRVREAAARYDFVSDFARDNSGAHAAMKRRYRHLKKELFPVFKKLKWDFDSILEEAKKYSRKIDFRNGSSGAYSRAASLGIIDEVCSHMGNGRLRGNFDIGSHIGKSGIYYLLLDGDIVYVGKSEYCLVSRVRDHYKDKTFDEVRLYQIENKSDILVLEAYLIAKKKPKYNLDYNSEDFLSFGIDNLEGVMGEPVIVGASFGVNGLNASKGR